MKVALLTRAAHPLHPPGGLERAVHALATHLAACGVETVLFTRPATEPGRFPGEVVTLPYGSLRGLAHGRVLDRSLHYPAFALRLGAAVAERVRAGDIDLVHAQGLSGLGYARLRRRDARLRAPLVLNPQGMEEHKARGLKALALARVRALSRETARLSDRVIATDETTRDEVPRLLGVARAKVVVLPSGIDLPEIRALTPPDPASVVERELPQLSGARPLLLSVGRLEAYKGFGDTLRALARPETQAALGPAWAWAVVGEGPGRAALLRDGAPLGSRLQLLGRLDDRLLHALYERADLFVHATRFEGSSLVTLEAMAHGLAIAATRAGGIPDKIKDGETGRLVEPGDVEGLVRAIVDLAGSETLRRDLGRRAREHAGAAFAWPVLAERTRALYEELVAGGGR